MTSLDLASFERIPMGNVLESDASTDSEIGEARTDGDGMETERNTDINQDQFPARKGGRQLLQGDKVTSPTNVLRSVTDEKVKGPVTCNNNLQSNLLNTPNRKNFNLTSPKELPPLKDLILLRPIRIGEGSIGVPGSTPHENASNNTQIVHSIPNKKHREPKFVPYEPYAGAVRPMETQTPSPDPRRESSSSSIALSDDLLPSHVQPPPSPKKASSSPRHPQESSNTALLKERLRISDKDIHDLRIENARLKRLLVDTLSGSLPVEAQSQVAANHRMQDSVDSLSNEIQVWRSKFLSSCVLVEYLTKEKEDLLQVTSVALELFKEIKATVDLTPELYEGMRAWIAAEEKERTLRKENSFSSLQDDDL